MKQKRSKEKEDQAPETPGRARWRENIEAILVAVLIALFIRTFVVQAFKIPSGSMKQTLLIGDHILVNKFIYGVKIPYLHKTLIPVTTPHRGDIIVFKFPLDPSKDFIKRVIAVGGDVLESRDKQLFVNNKAIGYFHGVYTDPHIIPGSLRPRDNFGPITVPPHSLFVKPSFIYPLSLPLYSKGQPKYDLPSGTPLQKSGNCSRFKSPLELAGSRGYGIL